MHESFLCDRRQWRRPHWRRARSRRSGIGIALLNLACPSRTVNSFYCRLLGCGPRSQIPSYGMRLQTMRRFASPKIFYENWIFRKGVYNSTFLLLRGFWCRLSGLHGPFSLHAVISKHWSREAIGWLRLDRALPRESPTSSSALSWLLDGRFRSSLRQQRVEDATKVRACDARANADHVVSKQMLVSANGEQWLGVSKIGLLCFFWSSLSFRCSSLFALLRWSM